MNQEPETSSTETTGTPETAEAEPGLKSLAGLLSAEKPETAPDEGKPDESPEKGKPKSLKALAETLELEDKDLYAIEVPMANGETRTLGQLKDLVAQQDQFALRELEWEEERHRKESELIRAQDELRELISALPQNAVKPEVLEKIRQKHEATLKIEREKTLEAIPEWKDENRRTEDIRGMVEHLKGYGFPETYIQSVFNHRTMKYIRDNWQREQRIRKALEAVKTGKPPTTATAKPSGKSPRKPSTAVPKGSRNRLETIFSGLD